MTVTLQDIEPCIHHKHTHAKDLAKCLFDRIMTPANMLVHDHYSRIVWIRTSLAPPDSSSSRKLSADVSESASFMCSPKSPMDDPIQTDSAGDTWYEFNISTFVRTFLQPLRFSYIPKQDLLMDYFVWLHLQEHCPTSTIEEETTSSANAFPGMLGART